MQAAGDDAYWLWAAAKFGHANASDPAKSATIWGENADPDNDGIQNLLEYTADTDPGQWTTSGDCYTFEVPPGPAATRHAQLTAWIRTDDPDLRVLCQTASDLAFWSPEMPVDPEKPAPANPHVHSMDTGQVLPGLRQIRYMDAQSVADRPAAFMRLVVTRRGVSAASPGIEPFSFTHLPAVLTGSVARSNVITLRGFTGTIGIAIPAGVTLYVNGVAQAGPSASVKAGDSLWMQAVAPSSVGIPRNHTLNIGGFQATWSFSTASIAALPDHPGTDSGYTPVEAGVSESGAAQISIPIVVSPGTAGMQPKLSINYSSQAGNGPLGLGFSLGGLSTISRTGATVAQDGFKGGVAFNANDRFNFDGQRLIAINGPDGGDGTEYRLEFDPTSRIFSYGSEGLSGPLHWTVETKGGLTLQLGNSVDSRVRAEGNSTALAWAVERITDSVGNEMVFSYDDNARTHGELLLVRIAYTSNASAGLATNQEVVCEYENRPDARASYIAGFAVKALKRLKAIESRATENGVMKLVRRYALSYQEAEVSGSSQLTLVQETAGAGYSLPPTSFTWDKNGTTDLASDVSMTTGFVTWTPHFDVSPPAAILTGDFNGDGLMDVAKMNEHAVSRDYLDQFLMFGKTDGTYRILKSMPDLEQKFIDPGGESQLRTGDFNADGLSDLLYVKRNGLGNWVALASPGEHFTIREGAAIAGENGNPGLDGLGYQLTNGSDVLTIDFTGDGRTDVLVLESNGAHVLIKALPNGKFERITNVVGLNGAQTDPSSGFSSYSWVVPGDFNGDGIADILHLYYNTTKRWLALGNGDGTFQRLNATDAGSNGIPGLSDILLPADYCYVVSGDYNGDGLTDLACIHRNTQGVNWIAFAKGNGQFQRVNLGGLMSNADHVNPPVSNHASTKIIGLDFNGDGLTDLFQMDASRGGNTWMALSKGDGTFDYRHGAAMGPLNNLLASNNDLTRLHSGDFDGDGREDILNLQYSYSTSYLARGTGFDKSRILDVTSGHGGYSRFAYTTLSDATAYTKGSGMAYPFTDVQAPMQVVTSITSRNGVDGDPLTGAGAGTPGESIVTYRYEGAWASLDGRGFQGFKAVESTDVTSGIVTRTEYESSSSLLAGRPKRSEQRLLPANVPVGGSARISDSTATWHLAETTHLTGRKTYFVSEATSVANSYETNRPEATALIKATTRSGPESNGGHVLYDSFANLIESTTTTTDGVDVFTERVVNTYADAPTPTQWHLGRLSASSVTKTAPGGETATRSSSFQYNPTTGLLTQEVIEPNGGLLRQQKDYVHDSYGNISTSTISTAGQVSRTTTTFYTTDGRFVRETRNAKNHAETKTYDPLLGNVLTKTGPNGLTTAWEYDALGRPVRELRPDGTQTRSFYRRVTGATTGAPPRAVHYVRVQSSGGTPKTVWYDLLDREIRADGIAFDGRTVSSHKVFNSRGEVTHASQPYFAGDTPLYSTMLYDAVGRETQQTDPGNRVTMTVHDGLTTYVTNPKNQTVSTVANAMGWTLQSTDAAGKSIQRSYDPYGALRFVTDPAGNATELRYDRRGNKIWMSEPNSGVSTFSYNGFGELLTQTNAASQPVTLAYDVLGRVIRRAEAEGVTTFEFDTAAHGVGQLSSELGGDFERSYYYDSLSRPAATVESHGYHRFAISRGYDQIGRPAALTYPTGFAVRQVYNAFGHLAMVQNAADANQFYWSALEVNARGQVTREVQGNGVVTDRVFETETGLIDAITASFNATGDIQRLGFDFDAVGNLTERRDERFTTEFVETFGYDSINRLTNVSTTGAAGVTVGYNDIGNISSRSDVGTFSYGGGGSGPHALTGVNGGTFDKACTYNAKGERVTDGATSLDYSSFGKPVRIRKGGDTLRFDYGTDRGLYRQTLFGSDTNGFPTQTVREYVGGLYERETTGGGSVRHTHYIAGGSGVVAIHTDERSASTAAQRTRYIHKDHLGSVDVITDSSGAEVERQSFDAWGRRRSVAYNGGTWQVSYPSTPTSAETHRGFTGHEMLDAVGLVHMGGRVYDPLTARFLSPDPFVQSPDNLQNLNRYSYVLNNPLSFTDPSGFFFKSIGKFFKKHWKTIIAVGVGLWTGGAALGVLGFSSATASLGAALTYGAAASFGSAFSGTLLAGGSVGDALRAGVRAAPVGAITEGFLYGADGAFADWISAKSVPDWQAKRWFTADRVANQVARIGSRGIIRGASSEFSGGSFSRGFAWSVIPDAAKFAVDVTVEYEFREQVARDPLGVFISTGFDPNSELQGRNFRHFYGSGGKGAGGNGRFFEDDENAISSWKYNQAGRSFTEVASKNSGLTSENGWFMTNVAQRLLGGNSHAISHDALINIRFLNSFKLGGIPVINEFSNVPWAIPTYTAHSSALPTPWVATGRKK